MKRFYTLLLILLFLPAISFADRARSSWYVDSRTVPDNQVEFWKLIFAEYGEDQYVFHYRDYPNIVYSVLDFSDLKSRYGRTRTFENHRQQRVNQEINKISNALQNLASGRSPKTDLEKRIAKQFSTIPGSGEKYRRAYYAEQIRYQQGIKEKFRDALVRSTRYLWVMEQIFREEGLPIELTRLPFVESSFDYTAYSSVGAAGIWQFMPATGRAYMTINNSIDERRDPVLATRAAAKYLANSYNRIGDWPLALTSYNHGLTGVLRAMKATGRRDLKSIVERHSSSSFGFASKNFYSEFAAALEIERNYQKYFPGLKRDKPLYFDEIRLTRPTAFSSLVKYAGTTVDNFSELNPALAKRVQQGYVPVPQGSIVRLPKDKSKIVLASLQHGSELSLKSGAQTFVAQLEARKKWEFTPGSTYRVRAGDTIGGIAQKHSISSNQLMSANNISDARRLSIGKNLLIPQASGRNYQLASNTSASSKSYVVRPGDSLYKIARQHGIKVQEIHELNPGLSKLIKPGQNINVSAQALGNLK